MRWRFFRDLPRRCRKLTLAKNVKHFYMKKFQVKKVLDLLVYVGICIWAVVSVITMATSNYVIQWQHYLGLIFLLFNAVVFYKNHQIGTLFLGVILLLAILGIVSFNVGLVRSSLYWIVFDIKIIPFFWAIQ
jgi:hypothetical protein